MTRLPLPEPDGWAGKDWYHRPATTLADISKFKLAQARYTADQMHAYYDACNAALQKQLNAAKAIIKGQDERSTQQAREIGPLMQRAADVAGEREANAILTAENAALAEQVRVLREACATFVEWLRREDVGFVAAGNSRETPEGEELWREWYRENLRICDLSQTQARAALEATT